MYHPCSSTQGTVPRVHQYPGYPPTTAAPTSVPGPSRKERASGLNGLNTVRAARVRSSEAAPLFPYLRPFSPGSQRPSRAIRGKCWIDPGTPGPRAQGSSGPGWSRIQPFLTRKWPDPDPFVTGSGQTDQKGQILKSVTKTRENPL